MKIGTVAEIEIKKSAKSGKDYSVVTLADLPGVQGISSPTLKVGDKVVYRLRIEAIEKLDERSKG